jgi:hypothetical protein
MDELSFAASLYFAVIRAARTTVGPEPVLLDQFGQSRECGGPSESNETSTAALPFSAFSYSFLPVDVEADGRESFSTMDQVNTKSVIDEDLLRTWLDTVIAAQRRNVQYPDDPYMEKRSREKQILKDLERMKAYLEERR